MFQPDIISEGTQPRGGGRMHHGMAIIFSKKSSWGRLGLDNAVSRYDRLGLWTRMDQTPTKSTRFQGKANVSNALCNSNVITTVQQQQQKTSQNAILRCNSYGTATLSHWVTSSSRFRQAAAVVVVQNNQCAPTRLEIATILEQ